MGKRSATEAAVDSAARLGAILDAAQKLAAVTGKARPLSRRDERAEEVIEEAAAVVQELLDLAAKIEKNHPRAKTSSAIARHMATHERATFAELRRPVHGSTKPLTPWAHRLALTRYRQIIRGMKGYTYLQYKICLDGLAYVRKRRSGTEIQKKSLSLDKRKSVS